MTSEGNLKISSKDENCKLKISFKDENCKLNISLKDENCKLKIFFKDENCKLKIHFPMKLPFCCRISFVGKQIWSVVISTF